MSATTAERKRAWRIRRNPDPTPDEKRWLKAYDENKKLPIIADRGGGQQNRSPIVEVTPPPVAPSPAPSPPPMAPEPVQAPEALQPAIAPVERIDMGPEPAAPPPIVAAPSAPSAPASSPMAPAMPGTALAPPPTPGMTEEVSRAASGMVFMGIGGAWRHWGDRDTPDPSAEQRKILAKVIANYATKYGWTSELDDLILLVTVIGTYNMQCVRAPSISEQKAKK